MGDTEEDVERRSDELEAVEAIYPTEFKLLTDFREVTGSGDGDGAGKSTVVEFSLSMGLGLQSSAESGPPSEPGMLILTFALPSGYPSTQQLQVSCRCDELSRRLLDVLTEAVAMDVDQLGVGSEAVLEVTSAALDHAQGVVEEARAAQDAIAAAAAAASKANEKDSEWRRVFFWSNHLLDGKSHKKEAQLKAAISATNLTGAVFFGVPGVVVVEGPQMSIDQFEKDARALGKPLKPKKSQAMPAKVADCYFQKVKSVSTTAKGGLNVEALQADLHELKLEHKFKHIIGLEDLQG
eukprot:m.224527 g.224527  ORF g.224527 m.224527 type:complete len:295 (+) comp25880_c0_seq1:268-1152(+)